MKEIRQEVGRQEKYFWQHMNVANKLNKWDHICNLKHNSNFQLSA